METVTIYKDSYESLQNNEFKYMTELAKLQGTIRALSQMDDHPEFVQEKLKEIVKNFENN
jgi:hypothetical protein